jgi:hypothetical protein
MIDYSLINKIVIIGNILFWGILVYFYIKEFFEKYVSFIFNDWILHNGVLYNFFGIIYIHKINIMFIFLFKEEGKEFKSYDFLKFKRIKK